MSKSTFGRPTSAAVQAATQRSLIPSARWRAMVSAMPCAICRETLIADPADLAERKIYSIDDTLKAIELAHRDCAQHELAGDFASGWEYAEPN